MEDVNRIVLVEKKSTSKWLSEQMGGTSTVSKWCTNTSQSDIASLLKIADLLKVDIKELIVLVSTKLIYYHKHNFTVRTLCS